MVSWQEVLDRPGPQRHFVQLYSDDDSLARNVGRYFAHGLQQGESGIIIAERRHSDAFRARVQAQGFDVALLDEQRRLAFFDAHLTLSRFMIGGLPEWTRFEDVICSALETVDVSPGSDMRAYGEMVGILWTRGEYSAAIKLEEFWNRLLLQRGISLFCSYPIDVFGSEFQSANVHAILCDHSHLLSAEEGKALDEALSRAMTEVLGADAAAAHLKTEGRFRRGWGMVPRAEAMILWLREHLPEASGEILARARKHYGELAPECR